MLDFWFRIDAKVQFCYFSPSPLDKSCLGRAADARVPDQLLAGGAAVALVVPAAEAVEAGPVAPQEPEAVLALVVTPGSGPQALAAQEESPSGAGEATAQRGILDINPIKIHK